ncbi:hypothetical protein CsSME_00029427 [Camellia sinensis var. sinensis]
MKKFQQFTKHASQISIISLEAGIWAVYKGLIILFQHGMTKVIVETDAEQVVKFLNDGPGENCPF